MAKISFNMSISLTLYRIIAYQKCTCSTSCSYSGQPNDPSNDIEQCRVGGLRGDARQHSGNSELDASRHPLDSEKDAPNAPSNSNVEAGDDVMCNSCYHDLKERLGSLGTGFQICHSITMQYFGNLNSNYRIYKLAEKGQVAKAVDALANSTHESFISMIHLMPSTKSAAMPDFLAYLRYYHVIAPVHCKATVRQFIWKYESIVRFWNQLETLQFKASNDMRSQKRLNFFAEHANFVNSRITSRRAKSGSSTCDMARMANDMHKGLDAGHVDSEMCESLGDSNTGSNHEIILNGADTLDTYGIGFWGEGDYRDYIKFIKSQLESILAPDFSLIEQQFYDLVVLRNIFDWKGVTKETVTSPFVLKFYEKYKLMNLHNLRFLINYQVDDRECRADILNIIGKVIKNKKLLESKSIYHAFKLFEVCHKLPMPIFADFVVAVYDKIISLTHGAEMTTQMGNLHDRCHPHSKSRCVVLFELLKSLISTVLDHRDAMKCEVIICLSRLRNSCYCIGRDIDEIERRWLRNLASHTNSCYFTIKLAEDLIKNGEFEFAENFLAKVSRILTDEQDVEILRLISYRKSAVCM